jgi:hypothetical protein
MIPLPPSEHILWQGRPNARPYITAAHLLRLLRGLIMLGLFLYILARLQMGVGQYFDIQVIVFSLFFLAVPLDILKSAYMRRISSYTLTNRHAIITTDIPLTGQKTQFLPILTCCAAEASPQSPLPPPSAAAGICAASPPKSALNALTTAIRFSP